MCTLCDKVCDKVTQLSSAPTRNLGLPKQSSLLLLLFIFSSTNNGIVTLFLSLSTTCIYRPSSCPWRLSTVHLYCTKIELFVYRTFVRHTCMRTVKRSSRSERCDWHFPLKCLIYLYLFRVAAVLTDSDYSNPDCGLYIIRKITIFTNPIWFYSSRIGVPFTTRLSK